MSINSEFACPNWKFHCSEAFRSRSRWVEQDFERQKYLEAEFYHTVFGFQLNLRSRLAFLCGRELGWCRRHTQVCSTSFSLERLQNVNHCRLESIGHVTKFTHRAEFNPKTPTFLFYFPPREKPVGGVTVKISLKNNFDRRSEKNPIGERRKTNCRSFLVDFSRAKIFLVCYLSDEKWRRENKSARISVSVECFALPVPWCARLSVIHGLTIMRQSSVMRNEPPTPEPKLPYGSLTMTPDARIHHFSCI